MSDRFIPWLWHMFFDGTRLCRCWRSTWIKSHTAGEIDRRKNACGNCDFCLLPIDVLIMRGELCLTTLDQPSTTRSRKPFTELSKMGYRIPSSDQR